MSLHEIELGEASFLLESFNRDKKVSETYKLKDWDFKDGEKNDLWDNLMTLTSPQYKRLLALTFNSKYEDLFKSLDELGLKKK